MSENIRNENVPESGSAIDIRQVVGLIYERLIQERSIAGMVAVLKTLERPQCSPKLGETIDLYLKEFHQNLVSDRKLEASAFALTAMFADADYAIRKMRQDGLLRASKYDYNRFPIANIIRAVLDMRASLVGQSEQFDYLKSVLELTKLAPDAKRLHDRIIEILRPRQGVVMKTVLVILNSRFHQHQLGDASKNSLSLDHYSSEEIAEAASLILDTYRKLFVINDNCCNYVDINNNKETSKIYNRLFIAAVRLIKFNDAEVMIDWLPFSARWARDGLHISSIDPEVEKSIRLGYIQQENQVQIRVKYSDSDGQSLSVVEAINHGFERGAFGQLLELLEWPVRRFRLSLPTAPQIFKLFRSETLFRDEVLSLMMIDADTFGRLDPNQLISPLVTVMDLLKIQRYFNFISCLYQRKLSEIEDESERFDLTFTSTILIIPHDDLLQQIKLILLNEAKSQAIIELLKIDYSKNYTDLQYTPLIDLGTYYALAPHVLAASNLPRNVIIEKGLREFQLKAGDPMIKAVAAALEEAGFKVRQDFKITKKSPLPELDLVAWRDDTLFLFECKNTYLPCSVREMRNSYNAIQKAKKQLDRRREVFTNPANQAKLFEKLGWDVASTTRVYTGIVIANRIFHGADFNGHPVRQAHELINVLKTGIMRGEVDRKIWRGDLFATDDLINYLTGDTVVKKQFQAFEPYENKVNLGRQNLIFDSYRYNIQRHLDIMAKNYRLDAT